MKIFFPGSSSTVFKTYYSWCLEIFQVLQINFSGTTSVVHFGHPLESPQKFFFPASTSNINVTTCSTYLGKFNMFHFFTKINVCFNISIFYFKFVKIIFFPGSTSSINLTTCSAFPEKVIVKYLQEIYLVNRT